MRDFLAALALLTVVPVPSGWLDTARAPGKSLAWFPLVGAGLGAVLALAFNYSRLFFSNGVSSTLLVGLWVLLTGALHLDGFSDACDGLFVAADPARRLEILHDVHLGTFGTVGLILLLLGKFSALGSLTSPVSVFLAPVLGRWAIVFAAAFPLAREQGMAFLFRAGMDRRVLLNATVLAALFCVWLGPFGLAAFVAAFGLAILLVRFAFTRLGGLTGDVYGMICETVEVGVLLVGGLML
ncbi:MAG TPA: adenosylcobinamide-GDP ribazoletransferase [Anaerolineae bacterium]